MQNLVSIQLGGRVEAFTCNPAELSAVVKHFGSYPLHIESVQSYDESVVSNCVDNLESGKCKTVLECLTKRQSGNCPVSNNEKE